MVIFLYNLYIIAWIQQDCLVNMVLALDTSKIDIKRMWCTRKSVGKLYSIPRDTKQLGSLHVHCIDSLHVSGP